MSQAGEMIAPNKSYREYHEGKYKIFKKMYHHFQEVRQLNNVL